MEFCCDGCGAPVRIALLTPIRCVSCGRQPTFPPAERARLEGLRAAIARRTSRTQQLNGDLAEFCDNVGVIQVFMAAMLWGLIGGLITLGAVGNLPPNQTFFGVVTNPPHDGSQSFAAVTFWMTLIVAGGFGLSLMVSGAVRFFARGQVRFAFSMPPRTPGSPPGCRVCGADLPARGAVVRRCQFCDADNLVDGVHFQRVTRSLDDELRARERAVSKTLANRQRTVERVEKLILGPPFVLMLLFPLVLFIGEPDVAWWGVVGATYGLAILLFVGAAMRPDPRVLRAPAK